MLNGLQCTTLLFHISTYLRISLYGILKARQYKKMYTAVSFPRMYFFHSSIGWVVYRFKFGNTYVILFCHKIHYIISTERYRFMLEIYWTNEKLHDGDDIAKKKLSFRMKIIFILEGTLITKIAVFGLRRPIRGLTKANASIMCDRLVQLVKRTHHWPIFFQK